MLKYLLLLVLVFGFICVLTSGAEEPPQKEPQPEKLPSETRRAWSLAGAKGDRMITDFGKCPFSGILPGEIAKFNFSSPLKRGILRNLPAPEIPFELGFSGDGFTDSDLAELEGMTNLRILSLQNTSISGKGFKYLLPLKNLNIIKMYSVERFSREAAEAISALPQLSRVEISSRYSSVSDEDLAIMSEVKQITKLQLSSSKVTDEGFKNVSSLVTLADLDVSNTKLTDKHMEGLLKLKKLSRLNIAGTKITGASFKYLSELKDLKFLDISFLKATHSELIDLLRSLPNCKFRVDESEK